MDTARTHVNKGKKIAQVRSKLNLKAVSNTKNHSKILKYSLSIRRFSIPIESAEALTRIVATANLVDQGRLTVTSTKDMSRSDFLKLIKASAPVE